MRIRRYKRAAALLLPCVILLVMLTSAPASAQKSPVFEIDPKTYVCYRAIKPIKMDGNLKEVSWRRAPWTDPFVDIEGDRKEKPRFATRAKMLWNDRYFYVAARLEEPHIWASLKQRDTVIYHDNDFEVFIDPDGDTHHYYELEVNAYGTVWDLMLTKPYRDGGRALDAWDINGLKTGIGIQGTLNNPADIDTGWTVEIAIPWTVLEEAAPGGRPPRDKEQWRVNFSRVQWKTEAKEGSYVKMRDEKTGNTLPEDNWVWSPQGLVNMHYPEMWGYVQFSEEVVGGIKVPFEYRNDERIKRYLRELYYRQHEYRKKNGTFAKDPAALDAAGLTERMNMGKQLPGLAEPTLHATKYTFEIALFDPASGKKWYIREDSKVWNEP